MQLNSITSGQGRNSFKARGLRLAAAIAVICAAAPASQAASNYPVIYNFPLAIAVGDTVRPVPPGANNWSCRPAPAHPYPVVLVPALGGDIGSEWQAGAPLLANNGYCVLAFDCKSEGYAHIPVVAASLRSFIDRVLTATNASKA